MTVSGKRVTIGVKPCRTGTEAKLGNLTVTEWISAIFFLLLMVTYSFALGDYLYQAITRVQTRTIRQMLRKWDVNKDLFRPTSVAWFTILGIALGLSTAFTVFVGYLASVDLLSDLPVAKALDVEPRDFVVSIAAYAFFVGLIIKYQSTLDISSKVKKLNNLREVYHQRFQVSELLSMYESLRSAPDLFWEEYANLPDNEVNEESNSRYRERAAPYHHSQSSRYNRIVITVAGLTLLLTAVLAAIEILS